MRAKHTEKLVAEPPRSRGRRLATYALRAMLFSCFTTLLFAGLTYHRARAQMAESFFGLGEQMMQFADARHQDTPRDLVINGQTIRFSSGTFAAPLDTLLDRFETRCHEVDGELAVQLERVLRDNPRIGREAPSSPTVRERTRDEGYVACLDLGDTAVPLAELARRVQRFGETADVSDVGDMRYLYGEEYEVDGQLRTHFVAIWTEGPFNVGEMFPEEGDVPGEELADVPRPPNARRVLSGYERGMPLSMTVYHARDTNERSLETYYRRVLRDEGWSFVETSERTHDASAGPILFAEKGDRMITVVLAENQRGPGASAAVIASD